MAQCLLVFQSGRTVTKYQFFQVAAYPLLGMALEQAAFVFTLPMAGDYYTNV